MASKELIRKENVQETSASQQVWRCYIIYIILSNRFEIVVMYLGSILIILNDLDVSMDRSTTLMR